MPENIGCLGGQTDRKHWGHITWSLSGELLSSCCQSCYRTLMSAKGQRGEEMGVGREWEEGVWGGGWG